MLAAQGVATAISLGVDMLLFRRLYASERGTLTAALGLRSVFLAVADVGLALTTVRVASEYVAKGMKDEANLIFRRALFTRLVLALLVFLLAAVLSPLLAGFPLAAANRNGLVYASAAALAGLTAISWGVDVARSCRRFGMFFAHQVGDAALKAVAVGAVFLCVSGSIVQSELVLWFMAAGATLAGIFSIFIQRSDLTRPRALTPESARIVNARLSSFNRYGSAIALLFSLNGLIEVFLIQYLKGGNETAIFEGARRLALILPLIGATLSTIFLPRAATLNSVEACSDYLRKAFKVSVLLALFSAGGLAALSDFIVPMLWGDRYIRSIPALHWLCLAYGLAMVINPLILVLYPLRREGVVVFLYGANAILSILAGLWLIPDRGALGAAWSSLLVSAIMVLLYATALIFSFDKAKKDESVHKQELS